MIKILNKEARDLLERYDLKDVEDVYEINPLMIAYVLYKDGTWKKRDLIEYKKQMDEVIGVVDKYVEGGINERE